MSLVSPGRLSERADLYHQLGQLTASGIPIISALRHLAQHPPAPRLVGQLQAVQRELESGVTVTEAMGTLPAMPAFDLSLLEAGERSGRLDTCFGLLSTYYAEKAAVARQILAGLIYPGLLLHFAAFIFPFADLFRSGDFLAYFKQVIIVLGPLYGISFVLIFAGQGDRGEAWRAFLENLLGWVPVLGAARRSLALGRLSAALDALLNAGVSIVEAWRLSAAASGSPALARCVQRWGPALDAGQTPAELVAASRAFPPLFASQYASGEISGRLDETLRGLHRYYQEEGTRKIRMLAVILPVVVYFAVALAIAYKVITFYLGYSG